MGSLIVSLLVYFVRPVIMLLIILIFVSVVMSWLASFNIINLRNPTVRQIYYAIEAVVRPVLEPFRRIIPPIGGLDFSPIAALLLLQWVHGYVIPSLAMALV